MVMKGFINVFLEFYLFYVCVYGGVLEDIVKVIWQKFFLGLLMVGNIIYMVVDDVNYVQFYFEYEIKWEILLVVSVYFKVELVDNNVFSGDIVDRVRIVIFSFFNGEDGGIRVCIGLIIYVGCYYVGVQVIDSDNVDIFSIIISCDGMIY